MEAADVRDVRCTGAAGWPTATYTALIHACQKTVAAVWKCSTAVKRLELGGRLFRAFKARNMCPRAIYIHSWRMYHVCMYMLRPVLLSTRVHICIPRTTSSGRAAAERYLCTHQRANQLAPSPPPAARNAFHCAPSMYFSGWAAAFGSCATTSAIAIIATAAATPPTSTIGGRSTFDDVGGHREGLTLLLVPLLLLLVFAGPTRGRSSACERVLRGKVQRACEKSREESGARFETPLLGKGLVEGLRLCGASYECSPSIQSCVIGYSSTAVQPAPFRPLHVRAGHISAQ